MKLAKRSLILMIRLFIVLFVMAKLVQAEEIPKKSKAEDMVQSVEEAQKETGSNTLRRAKLTEEQAINQLKFMMVKGWERIDKDLVNNGTFSPMGLVLSPKGDFKPLVVAEQEKFNQQFVLATITENLKEIAKTRSMWGVGLMYILGKEKKDGTFDRRIMVMTEHIAGWARHWAYPFKVVDGEVKLGAPVETNVRPVYFNPPK